MEEKDNSFKGRISGVKTTRWVRFAIVALIYVAWVAWMHSWWLLVFLPLLFDIYITGYIPFTWWKHSKNKAVVMIMSWVDAIVYALILVYFIFTFIGQNYQIPSSSLEKTLLTGDYLWVNKISYGPRVPMTPIHFPLVQNTMPKINTRSYLEWPQLEYKRLSGFGKVEAGDIVVFNFPAGDTITFKQQNPDYYTMQKYIGDHILAEVPELADKYNSLSGTAADNYRNALAKSYIQDNEEIFGEVMYRPVDRRENYVKRAVGLPGDTLKIVDTQIYINGKKQAVPELAQWNYNVYTSQPISDATFEQLGISVEDRHLTEQTDRVYKYVMPMTNAMVSALKAMASTISIEREKAPEGEYLFPDKVSNQWTRSDYGPLYIPKKGTTVKLTADNWPIYERIIRNYEGHTNSWVDEQGQVWIDGKKASTYTFAMDYYFMMGDNRDNSLDSRYWGFVPEDHIVGKPMRVLISFDKDKSLLNGGIRWNRIFKNANTGF